MKKSIAQALAILLLASLVGSASFDTLALVSIGPRHTQLDRVTSVLRPESGQVVDELMNFEDRRSLSKSAISHKPEPLEVELVPASEVTPTNKSTVVNLRVRSRIPMDTLRITISTKGTVAGIGPNVFDIAGPQANRDATAAIPYSVSNEGEGELRVAVKGAGVTESALVYVLGSAGEALHATSGPLDLRLKRLDRDHISGRIDNNLYSVIRNSIGGGGATLRTSLRRSTKGGTVSGFARWTDRLGGTHPVRFARVELRDTADNLLATTITAADGSYTLTTSHAGSVVVRLLCQSLGFIVHSDLGLVQHVDSQSLSLSSDSELSLDITANNVDDNNTAFSVADAILTETLYLERLGMAFQPINIVFPSPFGTFFDSSALQIHILRLDRFDWDVSMHEFGHYVAQNLGIDRSPGGGHGPGFNLSEFYGKTVGTTLAWSEGWATYFGISVQKIMATESLGTPFVGDTHYTDTEDFDFDYDLETQTGGFPDFVILSTGEDDEASVQRILWDLFDTNDDDGDQGVALGDAEIIKALQSSGAATLSEGFAALTARRRLVDVVKIGSIFSEHRVSPGLTEPADGVDLSSGLPTFEWVPNGGGPSFRNNLFVVQVYNSTFSRLLLTSGPLSTTSFTPSQSQWNAVKRGAGPEVHWVVGAVQLDDPLTGPYLSGERTLVLH